jgi:hypothetical protein
MLAKKQKAREVIQTALAAQKIYARPAIASEAQAAFDEQKSHITEAIIAALENTGILKD